MGAHNMNEAKAVVGRRRLLRCGLALIIGALPVMPANLIAAGDAYFDEAKRERRRLLVENWRRTLIATLKKTNLPIIDVEHHWGTGRGVPAFPVTDLLARMDRNGVALTWLGINESMGDQASIAECAKAPDRLVPTVMHGDGPKWHARDSTLLQELDTDARSGEYFAMGEFEARHYVSNTNSRDIHTPVNSVGFEVIFRASQETGLPFLLHHEAEDELLPELEDMLRRFPKAKVVWCHVGRNRDPSRWKQFPTPEGVREFISRYPNLYFDILQSGNMSRFPPNTSFGGVFDAVMYYQESGPARLRPEWLRLFNDFPERFVLGSDVNTGRWSNYDQVFDRFRNRILGVLSPAAAELIAYRNAWRLMTGDDWLT
jgi:predicted TIM-barrel fold metal-dependent hydrolase